MHSTENSQNFCTDRFRNLGCFRQHISVLFEGLQISEPGGSAGVAGHTPVPSRREGHGSYLRAVRKTGTLELLAEEPAVEDIHPFQDRLTVVFSVKCLKRQTVHLTRLIAEPQHIVKVKIMQFIRPHQILCFLRDLPVFRRQQFRAHRSIQYIIKNLL